MLAVEWEERKWGRCWPNHSSAGQIWHSWASLLQLLWIAPVRKQVLDRWRRAVLVLLELGPSWKMNAARLDAMEWKDGVKVVALQKRHAAIPEKQRCGI